MCYGGKQGKHNEGNWNHWRSSPRSTENKSAWPSLSTYIASLSPSQLVCQNKPGAWWVGVYVCMTENSYHIGRATYIPSLLHQ